MHQSSARNLKVARDSGLTATYVVAEAEICASQGERYHASQCQLKAAESRKKSLIEVVELLMATG